MTRKEFLQLPEHEIRLFIAKGIDAMMKNDKCFEHYEYIVVMSQKEGHYNVKFGNSIYKDQLTTTK